MKRPIILSLLALMANIIFAATTDVTSATLASAMADAADGDVLVLAEGKYGDISIPSGKTITLQAAEGASVVLSGAINVNNTAEGGLICRNIKFDRNNSYTINGSSAAGISTLEFYGCEITNVNRCFMNYNAGVVKNIVFDNCLIHDCGSGGWCFLYVGGTPGYVQSIKCTNSTLYNYTNGECFFWARGKAADNVFSFDFENNTVYNWGKDNSRSLCKTENNYSPQSTYTFKNNICTNPDVATKGGMLNAGSGTLVAENNLLVDFGGYSISGAKDLTLADLGLSAIGFNDPSTGDFSILSDSPIAKASTTGGALGDPRWIKTIAAAVTISTSVTPEGAGVATPVQGTYEKGTSVTLTAKANFGYRFNHWQLSNGETSTEADFTITLNEDITAQAIFDKLDTYTLTVKTEGAGGKWGKYTLNPEPVNGLYETGTEVTIAMQSTMVANFLQWDNGSTIAQRTVVMDSDKEMTALFDNIPFIVAWDFDPSEPRGNRPADYAAESDNAGIMTFHDGDGSTTSWGGSTMTFGGVKHTCARRYTDFAKMQNPRYFKAKFSTVGYENVSVTSLVAADNDCVHKGQKMQISLDDVNYVDLDYITLDGRSTEWTQMGGTLPKEYWGQKAVYVKWQGDPTTDYIGSAPSGTEGFYLAHVLVAGEDGSLSDVTPPALVSSTPAQNASDVSASGQIVLLFNERVVRGSGDCTLDGKALNGNFGSTSVSFAYDGLAYNKSYTFSVPAGAITDRGGNAYEGIELQFTTMDRPTPAPAVFDAVVAQDGSGDYKSVQEAIDAAPAKRVKPWLIFIKKGDYNETVNIPANKPFIHLIGQDRELVNIHYKLNVQSRPTDPPAYPNDVLAWPYSTNNPDFEKYGLQGGSVCYFAGSDFYSENITYTNDWGVEAQNGPQALAMSTKADRMAFYNCSMRSYQDTWQTTQSVADRHYCKDCYFEGAVDYIYGMGDCYFETCDIYNVRSGSVIVAPNHRIGTKWGYVFDHCTIDGNKSAADGKTKFGRPWHEAPKTVFLYSKLMIPIAPEGWTDMGTIPTVFADYGSVDANGNPVDTSNRKYQYSYTSNGQKITGEAKAFLTAEEAAEYTYDNVLRGTDNWNPRSLMETVAQPQNVVISDGTLSWDAVPYARCYVILNGDNVVGFSATTTFALPMLQDTDSYTVKAVNEYGSLGQTSAVAVDGTTAISQPMVNCQSPNGQFYNLAGQKVGKDYKGIVITNNTKIINKQ